MSPPGLHLIDMKPEGATDDFRETESPEPTLTFRPPPGLDLPLPPAATGPRGGLKLRSAAPAFQPTRYTHLSSQAPAFQPQYESSDMYQPTWMDSWPPPVVAFRKRLAAIPTAMKSNNCPGDTLKMHFETLQAKDPEQVLIARKLNHLGFDSPTLVKQHLDKYGTVEDVLVTHSRVRCTSSASGIRTRPASFGFIIMGSVEEAKQVLAQGAQQTVQGVTICVSPFEHRAARGKSMSEDGDGEDNQKDGDDEATATGSGTSVTGEDESHSEQGQEQEQEQEVEP